MTRIIDVPDIRMLVMQADVQRQIANLEASRAATADALKAAFSEPPKPKRTHDALDKTDPEQAMSQEQGITSMIEQRFRNEAKPVANDAAIELENLIIAYLQKIGVSYTFLNLYGFIDQVRAAHTDAIVRDRVNALVDSLTAPAVEMVEGFAPQSLGVGAGDTVVISADTQLTRQQIDQIEKCVKLSLPDGVKVLVLDKGLTLDVLKAANPIPPPQTYGR